MDRTKQVSLPHEIPNTALLGQRRVSADAADEIDRLGIWLALIRRKWVVAAVLAASVAIGLAYAFLTLRSYAYTTVIEIGTGSGAA